jgi:hypothetical protein
MKKVNILEILLMLNAAHILNIMNNANSIFEEIPKPGINII